MSDEIKEKQANSIILMSKSLVKIAGLKEEDLNYEDNY